MNTHNNSSQKNGESDGENSSSVDQTLFALQQQEERKSESFIPSDPIKSPNALGINGKQRKLSLNNNKNFGNNLKNDINLINTSGKEIKMAKKNLKFRDTNRRVAFGNTADIDKSVKPSNGVLDSFSAVSFSAKKRQPTLMPFNLPGDEIDYIEKNLQYYKQDNNTQYKSGQGQCNNHQRIHIKKVPQHKDPQEMTLSELILEVKQLRIQILQNDLKLRKSFIDGQKLIRENQQLELKLQFEEKNRQLLLKNLNKMRQNYFNNVNQISQSSNNEAQQKISQGLNSSIHIKDKQILRINEEQQQKNQLGHSMCMHANETPTKKQSKEEDKQLPTPLGSQSVPSEHSVDGELYHGIQQNDAPKRAAQQIYNRNAPYQWLNPSQRLQQMYIGANRRHNLQALLRNHQKRRQVPQRVNPGIEEEAQLLETQHNDETVLINKVNEMQIKTSRFDQPFLHFHSQFGNQNFYRSEDFIPNEEPLINVREFWAEDISHSYRMRLPDYDLPSYGFENGFQRIRMQPNFNQAGLANMYDIGLRYPNPYVQLMAGDYIQLANQPMIRHASHRFAASGIQNPPQNLPQRRTFGITNPNPRQINRQDIDSRDQVNVRMRLASHGPPLRNVNGDSHSLLEDENNDQSHQQINQSLLSNNSNFMANMSENILNQQRNSQHHQINSDDSVLDFEEEEKHQALPMRNNQMFLQYNNRGPFANMRPMGPPGTQNPMNNLHPGGQFSFDDGGMDEYDVADERAHLWEFINPDNMTYEEILALQDRIGYVTKGLTIQQINSFPKMRHYDVIDYLKRINVKQSKAHKVMKNNLVLDEEGNDEEEKQVPSIFENPQLRNLSEIEIKNTYNMLGQSRSSKRNKKPSKRQGVNMMFDENNIDEFLDGDEGIVNRRLPVNSYNHQLSPKSLKVTRLIPKNSRGKQAKHFEDEEGCENCKEEDEERKEGEGQSQTIIRQVLKNHTIVFEQELSQDEEIKDEIRQTECLKGMKMVDQSQESQNQERCAICFDSMKKLDYVKILTCSHYYHSECIDQWLTVEKRCPMCMMYLDNNETGTFHNKLC